MTNEVTPEQRKELAAMIMEVSKTSWFEAIRHDDNEKALILVDEIIKLGWRWDPPVTMENLNFNEVALKPAQEIELMDRIISGLPVDNVPFIVEEYMEDQGDNLLKQYEGVKLYDVNSLYPQEFLMPANPDGPYTYRKGERIELTTAEMAQGLEEAANMWVRIPEFDNYEVNALGDIRSRWTKRVLEVAYDGGEKYVDMHDKDGHKHDVNVRYVIEKVFGK